MNPMRTRTAAGLRALAGSLGIFSQAPASQPPNSIVISRGRDRALPLCTPWGDSQLQTCVHSPAVSASSPNLLHGSRPTQASIPRYRVWTLPLLNFQCQAAEIGPGPCAVPKGRASCRPVCIIGQGQYADPGLLHDGGRMGILRSRQHRLGFATMQPTRTQIAAKWTT